MGLSYLDHFEKKMLLQNQKLPNDYKYKQSMTWHVILI